LPPQLDGLHAADGSIVWNLRRSSEAVFKGLGVVPLKVDAITTAHDKIASIVERVGKAETGRHAEIVALEWIVRRAQPSCPNEVRASAESIKVEDADCPEGILRMEGLGYEMAETVVTDSQVQHQLPVDAPVVLRKKAKVDEAPGVVRPAGVEADAARRIGHDVRKRLVSDVSSVGVRVSSRRQIEHAAKLRAVRSVHIPNVL